MDTHYTHLIEHVHALHDLKDVLALLHWDQETQLPAGAVAGRARQIGALAALIHERETAPAYLDLVDQLAARIAELDPGQQVDVRETKWRLDRKRRLPTELVRERAQLRSESHAVWIEARKNDDFAALAPYLERLVHVEQRVAAAIDDTRPVYDVLLEGFEPGATGAQLQDVFHELRAGLLPLIDRVRARADRQPTDADGLRGNFPTAAQRRLNRTVAGQLGFDFAHGRLDESAHPFTTEVGDDVRITTRIAAGDLRYALFSTIHETGHALYEQGLPSAARGTPQGTAASLGVHESQSRLWENLVGRSEAFWRWLHPVASGVFPALADRPLRALMRAANDTRPSLIRTDADELTYNVHILLRFELERALVVNDLRIPDLPGVWREKMRAMLGIEPSTARDGVLQDVHWAEGLFGYFPTYTLGNLYAAQLYEAAQRELGSFEAAFARGDFAPLLSWLRRHIHAHGQTYRAPELIQRATGEPPNAAPLLAHLERKLAWLEVS